MSMLWTIVPDEIVFAREIELKFQEIEVGGVKMLVAPLGNGLGRIERLYSPNPLDYINARLQPGNTIEMKESHHRNSFANSLI